MNLLPLTDQDRIYLKRLNNDKATIFALKKLFINSSCKSEKIDNVQILAAQQIALGMIQDIFEDLSYIQIDDNNKQREELLPI